MLIAILLVGFYFRFAGLNWDDNQHLHPDERFLTQVLTGIELPKSLGEYFDSTSSPLNPRNRGYGFFVYGDFPVIFTRVAAEGLNDLCAPTPNAPVEATTGRPAPTAFDSVMRALGLTTFCYRADGSLRPLIGYDEVALIGRVISALFDLGTLAWLFLITRELYSTRTGLMAMALGALAVLNIQQAHFFTADTFATHFAAAAIYFAVRAAKTGGMSHFVVAGVASGLAIASRINVAPVLGIVALAAFGRALRAWDDPARSRGARIERALLQSIVAVVVAFVTVRIFMPSAFNGFLLCADDRGPLCLDTRWQENMGSISQMISGEASSNPDVQWTDRKPIVFPWVNMVFWGLGVPLGLTAWIGWALAGWSIFVRPYRSRATRTIGEWLRAAFSSEYLLIWVWVTAYFAWQGSQWVKSMRYLLPLYPFMAIFAGWALMAIWDRAKSATGAASYKRLGRAVAYATPAIVIAGTLLWAIAFTEIYRRPTTRVAASEWIYQNVPTAATLHYNDASGPRDVQLPLPNVATFLDAPQITGFRVPTDGELFSMTFRNLRDPGVDASTESLTLVVAQDPLGSQIVAGGSVSDPFADTGGATRRIEVALPAVALQPDVDYYLFGYTSAGSASLILGADIVVDSGGVLLTINARAAGGLPPGVLSFRIPQEGVLVSAAATVSSAPQPGEAADALQVKIALDPDGTQIVAEGQLEVPAGAAPGSYTLSFSNAPLTADQQYYFIGEELRGSFMATSSTLANEHWDDGIPLRTGGRDGFSIYRGIEIQNYNDDTPEKLSQMLDWLQQADYVFLSSNRLYGSIPRQPLRYPLASEYYRLLFTGQLGFDLIGEFVSYPTLGPFEFPDQETTQALGIWPDPTRLPEPGVISVPYPPAEEAFSVYDHPRVILFKKRADFSIQDVITQLSGLDLEAAYHGFKPRDETASPTGQMLKPADFETQQASGTWSALFDRNGLLNTAPGVGVMVWYVAVGVLGLFAFPILFVVVPGLADRGYGLARTLGVLLLSFLIWFPASFRVLPFTREAVVLMVIVLAAIGGLIARARWGAVKDFLRRNARLILIEEIVFAAAFLLFLLLRYGNPDLWNPWRGGEKPMDFAYFNAVIKSQYFPPYDPWFSGGFMTYYYYGWVMLASLVKLLGIVPAIAYNIAVPTIYALAAMGTFSVAHGIASRFGARALRREVNLPASAGWRPASPVHRASRSQPGVSTPGARLPIVAGVIASVFVMLIGNLGEVKLLYDKIGELCTTDETGAKCRVPVETGLAIIDNTEKFVDGVLNLVTGKKQLVFPTDWWYWNATRIIPASEGEAGPITEIPYFTFLYADLHAHMMALPITILVLGLGLSWVVRVPLRQTANTRVASSTTETVRSLPVGRSPRRVFSVLSVSQWFASHGMDLLSLILGGLAIGALRATNTADYPTYLGIGLVALAFGTWAAEPLAAKETWLRFSVRVGLMFGAATILFSPFNSSDRLGNTGLEGWTGSKTVLWAYLFAHGIFLFPIVTYLYVEMRRWGLRWTSAAWKRLGEWRWLVGVPIAIGVLAMAYFAAFKNVWVAVVAVPLMLATGALMLRPRLPPVTRFWLLMVFLAIALTLAVELVVFRGDISRMNMVFKFYYQVWVLLGIAGAVALGWMWRRASIELPRFNGGWRAVMVALVVGGMLYPPSAAINGKLRERFTEGDPPGLDGMAYMQDAHYTEADESDVAHELNLGWDYEAITWMQDNVIGTPVVAEGRSKHEYLWGSRVSINTGLPTILGWTNHQRQQRGVVVPGAAIDRRIQDVASLFGDPSEATARKILNRYGVKYIYVGELEKMYYPAESLAKFDQMAQAGELRVAHENAGVKIYEVIRGQ